MQPCVSSFLLLFFLHIDGSLWPFKSQFWKKSQTTQFALLSHVVTLVSSTVGLASCLTLIRIGNISWLTCKKRLTHIRIENIMWLNCRKQLTFCQWRQMIWCVMFGPVDRHGSVLCGNLATCISRTDMEHYLLMWPGDGKHHMLEWLRQERFLLWLFLFIICCLQSPGQINIISINHVPVNMVGLCLMQQSKCL